MKLRSAARVDHAPEVRRALVNVAALCAELGLEKSKSEKGKWVCPRHGGGSLSVRVARGTIQVRCFGCDLAGDALTLIAEARGLDTKTAFPRVLAEGARIAGLWAIVEALEKAPGVSRDPFPVQRPKVIERPEEPEPTYPDGAEVLTLWNASTPVEDDAEVLAMLEGRALSAALITTYELARVLPLAPAPLPRWARFGGRDWRDGGYRLIVPMRDARGTMRSFRAWRVGEGDGPKRITPAGHKAAGLVFACPSAVALLEGYAFEHELRIIVAEGEPDFLTWATPSDADERQPALVFGVTSGAWSEELAARIPDGAKVIVRTDHDAAGDKYAEAINLSLGKRCRVLRSKAEA